MLFSRLADRYVSLEIIRPFLMVVIGVIVIMLSVRLTGDMQLIIVNKVPAKIVLRMILYQMPEFVILGLPIAFMIATLLGLARMSKDFEIIAIRATGTGSKRIMRPILLMAALVSALSFFLNEEVVPETTRRSQAASEEAALQSENPDSLQVANIMFKGVDSRFFYVQVVRKPDKQLERILIFDSDPGQPYRVISAQRGTWNGHTWTLFDGLVQTYDNTVHAFVSAERPFNQLDVDTRIQLEHYLKGEVDPKTMSSTELKALIEATREGGQETRNLEIEYQSKFARPFATFFAALIAAPIGLMFARGGYIGFAISIILTFFYFVAQTIGEGFGNLGLMPITVAAWLPNLVFGVVGSVFYIQVK
ncbi:MAG: LptF/LptG family permease [Candidatus Sericytochromatia bacterium]|nr:LptF/LptG family permease [Candidatus Sericytochromatia bacterium]